jgi:hypothetical protein
LINESRCISLLLFVGESLTSQYEIKLKKPVQEGFVRKILEMYGWVTVCALPGLRHRRSKIDCAGGKQYLYGSIYAVVIPAKAGIHDVLKSGFRLSPE